MLSSTGAASPIAATLRRNWASTRRNLATPSGSRPPAQNLGTALVAIPAVALGILVGTLVVRAVRIAVRMHIVKQRPRVPRS